MRFIVLLASILGLRLVRENCVLGSIGCLDRSHFAYRATPGLSRGSSRSSTANLREQKTGLLLRNLS